MNGLSPLIWALAFYFLETLPLFLIAQKSEHPYAWLAWVPIANFWLMCDLADVPIIWLIAIIVFFPVLPLALIILWWRISESTNKPGWLGLFMVIPVVSIFVGYYMALVEPDEIR